MGKNDLSLPDYTRLYVSLHCQLGSQAANIITCPTITTILTQYHVSHRLKVFGQPGVDAVLTELQQLHDQMVLKPRSPKEMTKQEKSATLQYLMFLKKKHCRKIKGQGCADSRK
eukprot:4859920-Ditylum_brightwellii.AAC.1